MENTDKINSEIDRTIHFLEYEIGKRRSEISRPGYTIWALLLAIGSLLWLMLAVLGKTDSISCQKIFFIALFLSVAFNFFFLFLIFCSPSRIKMERREGRFRFLDERISFFLLELVRVILVLMLINQASDLLNLFILGSCYVFEGIHLIHVSFCIIYIYSRMPFPINVRPKSKYNKFGFAISAIWVTSGAFATIGLFCVLYSEISLIKISEWQIGIIIFSLSILVLLLFTFKDSPALLEQLDNIRQDLSLGQIDIKTAKSKIDLIIHGLTFNNILQSKINTIFQLINDIRNDFRILNAEISQTRSAKNFMEEEKISIEAIAGSIFDRFLVIKEKLDELNKRIDKVRKKIFFFSGMSKEIEKEATVIIDEIKGEHNKLMAEIKKAKDIAEQECLELKVLKRK
jgi:hypothetical protein